MDQPSDQQHDLLHLETFLPYRLSRLANRVSAALARIYTRRHELTVTEWRIMAILGRYPELSAREVAERGALDKVAVSRAVRRLVDSGLLIRETAPDDRRRSVLELSRAGQAVYDEIAPEALLLEKALLAALTPGERESLDSILSKLSRRTGQLLESPSRGEAL